MFADMELCRLCGSPNLLNLGSIPESDYFAGRVLDSTMSGGFLIGCVECRSMFRHPILTAAEYMDLYSKGVPDQWEGVSGREDMRVISRILCATGQPLRLLDIGCGAGEFLALMPANMEKFGIEPSPAALQAAARGVNVLGPEIEHLPRSAKFDAITMIDVIEHVADPASLLRKAYEHVSPGGIIIISSGNPECVAWRRVFKAKFWYVSFPEHITFPSDNFFKKWCATHGAVPGDHVRICYLRSGTASILLKLTMQLAYYLNPSLFNFVGRLGSRFSSSATSRRKCFSPGIPGLFNDHQVCFLKKPGSASAK